MFYGLRASDVSSSPVILVYDVLLSAVRDDSDSSLYLSRYMDFLQKHIQVQVWRHLRQIPYNFFTYFHDVRSHTRCTLLASSWSSTATKDTSLTQWQKNSWKRVFVCSRNTRCDVNIYHSWRHVHSALVLFNVVASDIFKLPQHSVRLFRRGVASQPRRTLQGIGCQATRLPLPVRDAWRRRGVRLEEEEDVQVDALTVPGSKWRHSS